MRRTSSRQAAPRRLLRHALHLVVRETWCKCSVRLNMLVFSSLTLGQHFLRSISLISYMFVSIIYDLWHPNYWTENGMGLDYMLVVTCVRACRAGRHASHLPCVLPSSSLGTRINNYLLTPKRPSRSPNLRTDPHRTHTRPSHAEPKISSESAAQLAVFSLLRLSPPARPRASRHTPAPSSHPPLSQGRRPWHQHEG